MCKCRFEASVRVWPLDFVCCSSFQISTFSDFILVRCLMPDMIVFVICSLLFDVYVFRCSKFQLYSFSSFQISWLVYISHFQISAVVYMLGWVGWVIHIFWFWWRCSLTQPNVIVFLLPGVLHTYIVRFWGVSTWRFTNRLCAPNMKSTTTKEEPNT